MSRGCTRPPIQVAATWLPDVSITSLSLAWWLFQPFPLFPGRCSPTCDPRRLSSHPQGHPCKWSPGPGPRQFAMCSPGRAQRTKFCRHRPGGPFQRHRPQQLLYDLWARLPQVLQVLLPDIARGPTGSLWRLLVPMCFPCIFRKITKF